MLEINLKKNQLKQHKLGWIKSFLEGFSQDENGFEIPWMSYPAIEFLQQNLNKTETVFEFGCGASTLFFARNAKQVIALETNPIWYKIITEKLASKGLNNVEIILMKDGLENENYEKFACDFVTNDFKQEKFDFIIVDSIKRFNCVKNSINAIKPTGAIILDDSERKNYQKIFSFLQKNGFSQQDFFGIAPGQLKIKNTSFFKKLVNDN